MCIRDRVWSYNDDNSSILYSDISLEQDLYGVPTTVEVIYTGTNNSVNYYAKAVNDDPNSPTSIISRGREIVYRDTDPDLSGIPTTAMLQEYAERLLKKLSSVEYTITYTHGYNGVRVGEMCIRDRLIAESLRCGLTTNNLRVMFRPVCQHLIN